MACPVSKYGEVINQDTRNTISRRYHTVTAAVNREFWGISSDEQNSFYVGSYGRNTAIDTSDIDILVSLPETSYNHMPMPEEMGSPDCSKQCGKPFFPHIQPAMSEQTVRWSKSHSQMG